MKELLSKLENLIGADICNKSERIERVESWKDVRVEDLPNLDLDLKEIIDIVAQGYKIETVPFYGNEGNLTELLGLHIDDGKELSVLINQNIPKEERILTIIHEFYHCLARKYNTTQSEYVIQALAIKKYSELYGFPEFDTCYCSENKGLRELKGLGRIIYEKTKGD